MAAVDPRLILSSNDYEKYLVKEGYIINGKENIPIKFDEIVKNQLLASSPDKTFKTQQLEGGRQDGGSYNLFDKYQVIPNSPADAGFRFKNLGIRMGKYASATRRSGFRTLALKRYDWLVNPHTDIETSLAQSGATALQQLLDQVSVWYLNSDKEIIPKVYFSGYVFNAVINPGTQGLAFLVISEAYDINLHKYLGKADLDTRETAYFKRNLKIIERSLWNLTKKLVDTGEINFDFKPSNIVLNTELNEAGEEGVTSVRLIDIDSGPFFFNPDLLKGKDVSNVNFSTASQCFMMLLLANFLYSESVGLRINFLHTFFMSLLDLAVEAADVSSSSSSSGSSSSRDAAEEPNVADESTTNPQVLEILSNFTEGVSEQEKALLLINMMYNDLWNKGADLWENNKKIRNLEELVLTHSSVELPNVQVILTDTDLSPLEQIQKINKLIDDDASLKDNLIEAAKNKFNGNEQEAVEYVEDLLTASNEYEFMGSKQPWWFMFDGYNLISDDENKTFKYLFINAFLNGCLRNINQDALADATIAKLNQVLTSANSARMTSRSKTQAIKRQRTTRGGKKLKKTISGKKSKKNKYKRK